MDKQSSKKFNKKHFWMKKRNMSCSIRIFWNFKHKLDLSLYRTRKLASFEKLVGFLCQWENVTIQMHACRTRKEKNQYFDFNLVGMVVFLHNVSCITMQLEYPHQLYYHSGHASTEASHRCFRLLHLHFVPIWMPNIFAIPWSVALDQIQIS